MPNLPPRAQAAIFDLDGTLLDTLGDLAASVNAALIANGFPQRTETQIRGFIGDGAEMLVRRAMPAAAAVDPDRVETCLASFQRHYGQNYAKRTHPYPGIPELLVALRSRHVPLGILSNKPHAFTLQCAEAYFGQAGKTFQIVFGQREGVPRKPDPAAAIEAAEALGVPPDACVYVGDSGIDMQTAAAAGMLAVGVAWGFRPSEELHAAGALEVIDSPGGLLAFFAPPSAAEFQS